MGPRDNISASALMTGISVLGP